MKTDNYMERRFEAVKRHSIQIGSTAGMIIRIVLLIIILIFGKMFLDWAVDQSHNSVTDYELKTYKNEKFRILVDMRTKNMISDEQLKYIVDSIETNAKRDFILERR